MLDRRSVLGAALAAPVAVPLLDAAVASAAPANARIVPFRLAVPERELIDLRDRLRRARWPERSTEDGWVQGAPLAAMRSLCDYWATRYDWRRCETMLNDFGQYRTTIDDLGFHFLHVRSPEPDALPIVMTHGWPGSVAEFGKVVGPLTDPAQHGGDPRDAFHLVMPSLPGHGFSDRPKAPGWNAARVARAWAELMRRLGYDKRWGAQGGDWGELVAMTLGNQAPDGLVGIHASTIDITPTEREKADANVEEKRHITRAQRFRDELSAYFQQQATRPQTIGYALADSPVAQAAWIYEKYRDWTDNNGEPESAVSRDEILDQVMMYWLPNAGASSARFYRENATVVWGSIPVSIPSAFSIFPKDISGGSRRWADARFSNIVHWSELDRGGHFAALEQPDAFVRELRAGFRSDAQLICELTSSNGLWRVLR